MEGEQAQGVETRCQVWHQFQLVQWYDALEPLLWLAGQMSMSVLMFVYPSAQAGVTRVTPQANA